MGDKDKYTDKQKRRAEHIAEGYTERGVSQQEATQRAWATVNKIDHGGNKSGSGRNHEPDAKPMKKGGHTGGKQSGR
jgi:plasmid stabilization system protein ParE